MNKLNKGLMVLIIALLLVTIGELIATKGLIKEEPIVSYLRYETPVDIAKNYTIPPNALAIQKVDSVTNAPIENATFDIEYIDERTIPPLGPLTANGGQQATSATTYNANVELPNVVGTMVDANTYYFEDYNGGWRNNNRTTRNSLAESYIPIDLSNLPVGKDYIAVINYTSNLGNRNDTAYAYTTKNTTSVTYEDLTKHMFIDKDSTENTNNTNVTYPVRTGNVYYLHFSLQKGNNQNTSTFQINSIHVYEARNYASYSFTNNNGVYTSNNRRVGGTCANSYVELDLTNYVGKYDVAVNATISSEDDCDWGYVTITENSDAPEHDQEEGRLFHVSGATSTNTYTTTLDAGKKYYIHMGYDKDKYTDENNDRLIINSITVTLNTDDNIDTSVTTDNEGIAYANNAIAGKYRITETAVPNGYNLDSTPAIYEFDPANNDPFVITNVPKATLLVHHYEDGTTNSVSPDEVIKGTVGENYTTSGKTNITGYVLDEDNLPSNATGTFNNGVIEITYYYNQLKNYTVEYYFAGTKDDSLTDTLQKGLGKQVSNVQDKNKTGYKFDHYDGMPLTIVADESQNIIKVYYVIDPDQTKEISYTVNYYKDNTLVSGDTIQVVDTVQVLDPDTLTVEPSTVNTTNKYDGYVLDRTTPSPIPGTVNDGDVISIYYKKRTDLSYTVKYLDKDTNEVINTQKVVNNKTFEDVVLPANEIVPIDGYNYDSADKAQLVIGTGTNELTLYYTKRNDLSYTVNYLDKDTNEIIKTAKRVSNKTYKDVVNSSTEVVPIDGYNYDSVSSESITIGTGTNEITIYYTKRNDLSYTVNYLDKDTDEIIKAQKTVENKTFKDVINAQDEVVTISGYNYDSASSSSITIGTGTNEITLYYTKREDLSYVVKYLDKDTDEIIKEQKTVENKTYLDEITARSEIVAINGYNYDSASVDPLVIRTGTNEITLYYTKREDLSYIVRYLDKDTDEIIKEEKTVENQTFKDVVNSSTEVVSIDGYNYDSVSSDSITIGTGTNEIIIYYTKRNDLSYIVKYLDKDTDEIIKAQKTVENQTFKDVVNSSTEVVPIDGYNYDSVSSDSITIGTGTNEITIYYTKRNDLSYTVNYLEKGTNSVIKTAKRVSNKTFKDVIRAQDEVVAINGYNYDSSNVNTLTIGTDNAANVINLYYTKKTDLSYKVNYIDIDTDEVIKTQKIVNNVTFEQVINSADEVVPISGYDFVEADKTSITIGTEENVINLYYEKGTFRYTVEYYFQNVKDNSLTETINAKYLDEISTYEDKVKTGYKFDRVEGITLTIGVNEAANLIKVYYVIDDSQRKDISYTVEYYKEGRKVDADTQVVEENVQVLEPSILNVRKNEINTVNKYVGFKFDRTDPEVIPEEIGSGSTIKVYYVRDGDQTKDLNYTVEYYKTNVKVEADTQYRESTVYILDPNTIDVNKAEINTVNKYLGYKLDKITLNDSTISEIPDTVDTNSVIKVYYIIDNSQRKDISYFVDYYKDNEIVTSDTEENSINVQVLEPDTLEVDKDEINTSNKYVGYVLDKIYLNDTVITEIPDTVTNNDRIKVYYKKGTFGYRIEYYYANVIDNSKTETGSREYLSEITTYTDKVIDGYVLDKVETLPLVISENSDNNVLKIYYKKRTDLSYRVNYLEKGTNAVLFTAKNVSNKTFGDVINSENEVIAITGYDFVEADKESLTIGTSENVINLYYEKGTFKYTVKYYYANRIDSELTEEINAKYKDVISTYTDKVKPGYEFDKVEGTPLTISENLSTNLIEVYYKKRSDLSYTVNYLEKDTGRVLEEAKVVNNVTFEEEYSSSDEIIDIDGFDYDSANIDTLKINVSNNIINLYYTKGTFSYKVEYYYNNVIDNSLTENKSALFEDEITTYTNNIKYGYKFDKTENLPLTIKSNESQNVIKVFYAIDEDQVKTLNYTVEYYKDGELVTEDTDLVEKVVQVLQPDTLPVIKADINTTDKYTGYGFVGSDPRTIPNTIATGSTIKIYYEKGTFPYTVEYYYSGSKDEEKTVHLNAKFEAVIEDYEDKVIDGYKLSRTEGLPLTISEDASENIIKVYYEKRTDLSYTVNYLEQGTDRKIKESKVVDGQLFGREFDTRPEIIEINGYNYASISSETMTIGTSGNIINIYYTKIGGLSYTVNYKELGTEETIHISKEEYDKFFEDVVNASDEVISIEGYNYNSSDKDSITIGTTENVLNLYYTKRNDLTYTINYLEKNNPSRVLATQKVVHNARFKDEISASSQVIAINGFNYSSADKDGIIVQVNPNENIINLYYTKRNDLKYTVKYLEKDTGRVLHDNLVVENQTFEQEITALDEVIDISGYYYSNSDKNSISITTDENSNVITLYYTKRTDLNYYVKYVDKDTGAEIKTQKTVKNNILDSTIDTSIEIIDIEKYDYDSIDKTELVITGEESNNVITLYYTKKISTVSIKYLDKYTGEVLDSRTITDKVDTEYSSERKEFEGYTFIESEGDLNGNITVDPINVTYKYAINSKVIVKYVDVSNGSTITDSIEISGYQGKEYNTEKKSFDGYVFKRDTGNTSGTMGRSTIEVVYSYDKISQGVIERHIDASTGTVLYEEVHTGNVGDEYETAARTFDNYRIDSSLPENATGEMTDDVILVVYKYHKASSLTVKYVDYYSNKEIDTNTIYSGYESDTYNLANAIKTISGYTYDESVNDIRTVTVAHEPEEYIIYYKKNSSVVVKYIDEASDEVIDSITLTGKQGDDYETEQKEIDGYEFDNSEGDLTGTFKENSTEVRYYYLYKTKVQVKYVDKNTGEELSEMVEYEGLELDNYNVSMDLKQIDGYTLIEEPEEKSGTMTKEIIVKTYYYSKNTEVEIEFYDVNSGETIKESKTITGYVGKDYSVEKDDISGYIFVKDTGNTKGNMETDTIVVRLGYAKEAKLVVNYYDIKSGKILNTKEYNSKEGDSYETESIEINGYDLVKENIPENSEGNLDAGLNEVKYYYIRKTTVRVRKVDGNGNLLKPDVVIEGHEGDSYKIETELFDGYNLRMIPENKEGEMKVTINSDGSANIETVVTYVYDEIKEDTTPKQEVLPKTLDINNNKIILVGGLFAIGIYMVFNLGRIASIRPSNEKSYGIEEDRKRAKNKKGKHSR